MEQTEFPFCNVKKTCIKCNTEKPIDDFKNYRKNKKRNVCKKCFRKHDTYSSQRTAKTREYVKEFLRLQPCVDCGYGKWEILQFDHKNPQEKKYDICDLIHNGRSLETLKKEIEKCDVVCPNCHAWRTSRMFGSWRLNKDNNSKQ